MLGLTPSTVQSRLHVLGFVFLLPLPFTFIRLKKMKIFPLKNSFISYKERRVKGYKLEFVIEILKPTTRGGMTPLVPAVPSMLCLKEHLQKEMNHKKGGYLLIGNPNRVITNRQPKLVIYFRYFWVSTTLLKEKISIPVICLHKIVIANLV